MTTNRLMRIAVLLLAVVAAVLVFFTGWILWIEIPR